MIGAKGSGKTYIGNLLENKLGITFLRVEQRLIEHIQATGADTDLLPSDGYNLELDWLGEILGTKDEVISEATGSSKYLQWFISQLDAKYTLKLVRIYCPLEICLDRLKDRTSTNHFDVSSDRVRIINAASDKVNLEWSLEIDNSNPASDAKIISAFKSIR